VRLPNLYVTFSSPLAVGPSQAKWGAVFYAGTCSGELLVTEVNGTLDDGSFDNPYLAGSQCRWRIRPNAGVERTRVIEVTFTQFDMSSDFLRILHANSTTLDKLLV
jgi:hypothetical protein